MIGFEPIDGKPFSSTEVSVPKCNVGEAGNICDNRSFKVALTIPFALSHFSGSILWPVAYSVLRRSTVILRYKGASPFLLILDLYCQNNKCVCMVKMDTETFLTIL